MAVVRVMTGCEMLGNFGQGVGRGKGEGGYSRRPRGIGIDQVLSEGV